MTAQQDLLRSAMADLEMTRAVFAVRVGCPVQTMDKWLLPTTSSDYRPMPENLWILVREVLAHEALKKKVANAKNNC